MPGYVRLRALVEGRYGIVIPPERESAVRWALNHVCSQVGASSLMDLYRRLQANSPETIDRVLSEVTINHTGFLRERTTFDFFMKEILPSIQRQPEVRIWSAASSTGEELYSLVILLAEALGMSALEERWRFLGTDINSTAIEQAEAGTFAASRLRAFDERLRSKYFAPDGAGRFVVDPRVRRLCTFRRLNLLDRPLPFKARFDVTLCRNVLYYFSDSVQRMVLQSLFGVTRPGGWLLTGASESIDYLGTNWARVASMVHRSPS